MSATNMMSIIGNVGREVRTFNNDAGDVSFITFSLAVNEWEYDPDKKEKGEITTWVNVKASGFVAARLARFAETGGKFHLVGRFFNDQYEKDGETKYRSGIDVKDFDLLGGSNSGSSDSGSAAPQHVAELDEDEFPF